MEVIEKKIEDVIPYEHNPRMNDKAVAAVAASIREFGFKNPIVVDRGGVIIAGHTRLKAAQKLGLKTVPVICADDLTEEQVKAFRLADNKTAELAGWDTEALEIELAEISEIDMSAFGFEIAEPMPEPEEDNFEIELPAEPETKVGDIYLLGDHRLMCGDSTKKEDVEKLMEGVKADLFLTDPPYNVGLGYGDTPEIAKKRRRGSDGSKIKNDLQSEENFQEFLINAFTNANDSMRKGAAFYCWYASTSQVAFQTALEKAELYPRQILIWVKNAIVLGRQDYQWQHEPCFYGWKSGAGHYFTIERSESTVIPDEEEISPEKMKKDELIELVKELMKTKVQTTVIREKKPAKSEEHPTMKPVKLFARQIHNSTKQGETVLDLFGGSGTAIIASEQLGRSCRAMEMDPRYCDVIVKRWETYTGRKAERIREEHRDEAEMEERDPEGNERGRNLSAILRSRH